MSDVLAPARLGPLTLRNRVIKAATFEGRTPQALVTDELVQFHREVAAGGVGMTTVAYCAVSPGGRTDRHQIWMREEAVPGLRELTAAVHAEGAAVSAQLGHAGPVANAKSNRSPALAPSRMFNPLGMRFTKVPDARALAEVVADHARAARLARESGFDAVEVHLGHNYLASAFLSPMLNRRKDDYGGALRNRARLARDVVRAVREAVGDTMAVTAKLTMEDGVRGGFSIEESLQVARWLQDDGAIDALELTAGSSLLNPMAIFRGDAPRKSFGRALPIPVRWGFQLVGKQFLREYPYRPAYLLDKARRFRAELTLPLISLGGITDLATAEQARAEGFDFVAMGRALLREPDLIRRWSTEPTVASLCTHCNECVPSIYTKTHCVLRTS
ncbi:NADH:flavin oxidoreductase [Nocardia halotolerans]|uniref:NADH:flavin oxidoreductase n=1 Tax=Nocardia halotolerans TaxID=1755878 RepID=A0ABV8VKJ0_9NOCA